MSFMSSLGSLFGGPQDLESMRRNAESAEGIRLRKLARQQRIEAGKAVTEGIGIAERPEVTLGFEDEADSSFEADDTLTPDTGLIL